MSLVKPVLACVTMREGAEKAPFPSAFFDLPACFQIANAWYSLLRRQLTRFKVHRDVLLFSPQDTQVYPLRLLEMPMGEAKPATPAKKKAKKQKQNKTKTKARKSSCV